MSSQSSHTRTRKHNLTLASSFAMVAGMVNVTGFLSVHTLTTHITGHVAFLAEALFNHNTGRALILFLYIFFFWLGAFISGVLIETVSNKNERSIYLVPVILESWLLGLIGFSPLLPKMFSPTLIAFVLLFAMGLQNATVTQLTNALVRTTHLTGLFTDLGIELAQTFFSKESSQRKKLRGRMQLRVQIVAFFLTGGLLGGLVYSMKGIYTLLIPALFLIIILTFDYVKFTVLRQRNKLRNLLHYQSKNVSDNNRKS
ncbi:YoaK family protein [Cytophagaceae bacterium YF14B1]|uniref:YoaK family protein n=1 Tax=Xanthocytophaga flava TaxID=3048013 RepID=A0AAE3QJN2_9BACT|nr:YoaK family protein [Xanthocytophaga flavus]MDJ1479856.1 YoaK family protein [Xanthocytophaga flavus]